MSYQFYNQHADQLAKRYLAKNFVQVHGSWMHILDTVLNKPQLLILDVGAGAGRDSKYLAQQGARVVAVEPASELARIGMEQTKWLNVDWVNDSLPHLPICVDKHRLFDLVLLSDVWVYLPDEERANSLNTLVSLLKPQGKIVITLRQSGASDEQIIHTASVNELVGLAHIEGLIPSLITHYDDTSGVDSTRWQTVVLIPKERA